MQRLCFGLSSDSVADGEACVREELPILGSVAFADKIASESDFRWWSDRWGNEFFLHPHFFLDRQIIANGAYEASICRVLQRLLKPGMSCLDVGANIGALTLVMAEAVSVDGIVHAFEPIEHIVDRLRNHRRRSRNCESIHLHQIALSDCDGEAEIRFAHSNEPNQGMGSIVNDHHPALSERVLIKTRCLDSIIGDLALHRLDLIKVDIQGAEPLMLRGALQSLKRFQPYIMMEVSPYDLQCAGESVRSLLQLLADCAYEFREIGTNGSIGEPIEMDEIPDSYSASALLCTSKR